MIISSPSVGHSSWPVSALCCASLWSTKNLAAPCGKLALCSFLHSNCERTWGLVFSIVLTDMTFSPCLVRKASESPRSFKRIGTARTVVALEVIVALAVIVALGNASRVKSTVCRGGTQVESCGTGALDDDRKCCDMFGDMVGDMRGDLETSDNTLLEMLC